MTKSAWFGVAPAAIPSPTLDNKAWMASEYATHTAKTVPERFRIGFCAPFIDSMIAQACWRDARQMDDRDASSSVHETIAGFAT